MKHIRPMLKPRAGTDQKIEAALKRFQANLTFILALALLGLVVLGGQMGTETKLQSASLFGTPEVNPWFALGSALALIVLNSLFVSSETAIEYLRPLHAKYLKESNPAQGQKLQTLLDQAMKFASSMSLASQITKVLLIVVCFMLSPKLLALFMERAGWQESFWTLFACLAILMIPIGFLNLVFGELIPKSYAALHPPRVALINYRMIRLFSLPLAPLSALVTGIANLFTARFGGRATFIIENQAEEEIKTIVKSAEETGEIEQEEKELLHSVFEFTDTIAREVMTPRVDLDAVSIDAPPMDVMKLIQDSGHSRIPLYESSDDQIVGIVHAKDLLMTVIQGTEPNLRLLKRPAIFVPENKNLHELLEEMRRNRTQMVIVQDEFGGTAGIVTIEDIVEELVGDIIDEYDFEEPEIQVAEDGWIVDGRAHVDDVNHDIGSQFESEEFDTIGGLVFGLFGRQPQIGETFDSDGYQFIVSDTDGRRISKLKIVKLVEEPESAGEFA